jgi:hypothetical protein
VELKNGDFKGPSIHTRIQENKQIASSQQDRMAGLHAFLQQSMQQFLSDNKRKNPELAAVSCIVL